MLPFVFCTFIILHWAYKKHMRKCVEHEHEHDNVSHGCHFLCLFVCRYIGSVQRLVAHFNYDYMCASHQNSAATQTKFRLCALCLLVCIFISIDIGVAITYAKRMRTTVYGAVKEWNDIDLTIPLQTDTSSVFYVRFVRNVLKRNNLLLVSVLIQF